MSLAVIGVGGVSCGGKSTLAKGLVQRLQVVNSLANTRWRRSSETSEDNIQIPPTKPGLPTSVTRFDRPRLRAPPRRLLQR